MAYGSIMDRLNETRPIKSAQYNPFIKEPGNHELVIVSIEPYLDPDQNHCVRATFLVEGSDNPQVQQGMLFDGMWNLDKPPPFTGGEREKDRFAAFLNALQGVPTTPTSHLDAAHACLQFSLRGGDPSRFPGCHEKGQLESQPARGLRIRANAYVKMPGPRSAPTTKPFTVVNYQHVSQQDNAAMRAMLDQRLPYTPRPQQQQVAPQQPTTGWGAPQVAYPNAPHAAAQPQYAPPAAAPAQPTVPVGPTWAFPPK